MRLACEIVAGRMAPGSAFPSAEEIVQRFGVSRTVARETVHTLSMLGLFSLVTLDVANRRQEFAIRMAVGADSRHIVGTVFRAAGRRAALGIAIGLAVSAAATRSLQSLLFGVSLGDAATYGSVIALVIAVVSIASYLPARQAGATNPLALLRR